MYLKKQVALCGIACLLMTGLIGCGNKEWEMNITEETVYVEGLEEEYTLLFLADTHMVVPVEDATGQEAQNQEERAHMFVNEEGVASWEQFPEWITYANELDVDAVLLGGDIIDTPSEENLQWLQEQLEDLEMPYLYVNGNHDWTYPWEYMTQAARDTYLPKLEQLMGGNTVIHSLDLGGIKLVGIDNSTNQVDAGVFPEYEKLLQEDEPMVVLAHVPFMTQSVLGRARDEWSNPVVIGAGNYGGIYPNEHSERFVEQTTDEESPVELVLAGHVHFYDRDVIDGEKDVLQIVGAPGFEGNATLITLTGKK